MSGFDTWSIETLQSTLQYVGDAAAEKIRAELKRRRDQDTAASVAVLATPTEKKKRPPRTGKNIARFHRRVKPADDVEPTNDPRARMNKLERAYADLLDASPEVASWKYESIKLRMADLTWLTPDFFVVYTNNVREFHETKGFWEEDARVKIKAVAALYPFTFVAVKREKGGVWMYERFSPA